MFGRNVAIILRHNITEVGGNIVPPNVGASSPFDTTGIISHTTARISPKSVVVGLVIEYERNGHKHTGSCIRERKIHISRSQYSIGVLL